MAGKTEDMNKLHCSFCGKTQDQVKKLIAGPNVYICDECIDLCSDIIEEEYDVLANKDENSQFILNYFSTAFEKLGYKVLYEGVETDEQETICVNSHADYLQGFKFSKPIPIEELKNFLSPIQE